MIVGQYGKCLMPVAAALALVFPATASGQAPVEPGHAETCELHVSGAANVTHPHVRKTLPMRVPVADPELGRYEETGLRALLHPTVRVARLDKAQFASLFPEGRRIVVIVHDEVLDERSAARSKVRLHPSAADCYGDLILSNIYGVFPDFEQARERLGVLAGLVGGNRIEMTFRYHFFPQRDARPLRIKESVDVPVDFALEDVDAPSESNVANSIAAAANRALGLVIERHRAKLP